MPDLKIVFLLAYAHIRRIRIQPQVVVVASLARFHFWNHPPRCPTASGNTVLIQRTTIILQITTIGRGIDSYQENIFSEKNPTG